MSRAPLALAFSLTIVLTACSASTKKEEKIYPAGEKAKVDSLTYAVVDTQIFPQLGDDPATARTPANRFYVVHIAVSNGSNADVPIPALTLVDDAGQTYNELGDGTGVPNWLGVIRKVKPGDTELGTIAFDAPSRHYRLRLTDDLDPAPISIDLPLNFVHEQIDDVKTTLDPAEVPAGPPAERSKK